MSAEPSDLAAAYDRLNAEQQRAVEALGNTAVLAGPGSGKTDTLVLKAAHLLADVLPATRSLACLTYSNDAAREFESRLLGYGLPTSRRLFAGTVHGFALSFLLRGLGSAVDATWAQVRVIGPKESRRRWISAFDAAGINENPDWIGSALGRIRRAKVLGGDVSGEDDRFIAAAASYDSSLKADGCIDFEAMVLTSWELLNEHPHLRRLVAARFPWLLIDEYQDLGEPLHRLVQLLVGDDLVRVFAVGDPDQSIYSFSGADPQFLRDLIADNGFEQIDLEFNYRAGDRLIRASEAALQEKRNYQPDPRRKDRGEVYFVDVSGGIPAQAEHVTQVTLPELRGRGVQPHEIAVLYPRKGALVNALVKSLESAEITFVAERDARFPGGRAGKWLQRCARRASDPNSADAESLRSLALDYDRWLRAAGRESTEMERLRSILSLVEAGDSGAATVEDWVRTAETSLGLSALLKDAGEADSLEDLEELLAALDNPAVGMAHVEEFAEGARVTGRVVLTTYHSSKGRQFDAVVLPGLQEQLMPVAFWNPVDRQMITTPTVLREQRRLFYVGITRARRSATLISSRVATNDKGFPVARSRFVAEIETRLREVDTG